MLRDHLGNIVLTFLLQSQWGRLINVKKVPILNQIVMFRECSPVTLKNIFKMYLCPVGVAYTRITFPFGGDLAINPK